MPFTLHPMLTAFWWPHQHFTNELAIWASKSAPFLFWLGTINHNGLWFPAFWPSVKSFSNSDSSFKVFTNTLSKTHNKTSTKAILYWAREQVNNSAGTWVAKLYMIPQVFYQKSSFFGQISKSILEGRHLSTYLSSKKPLFWQAH